MSLREQPYTQDDSSPVGSPAAGTVPVGAWIRRRWTLIAASLGLAGLAFAQSPGRTAFDTKLAMVISPGSFIAAAARLWDPTLGFGEVQNQTYGYLFPQGPFYWLTHALSIAPWVAERLWLAGLMWVALWGIAKLAESFGIGTPLTRSLAAVAYAASPYVIALASASGGLLPYALLPWVLLPLVAASRSGSYRRGAMRSGVAIACMGGINASAVLAVLTLPALWLLLRRRVPGKWRLLAWWILATLMACFWWAQGLIFYKLYGFNFLHFTETSRTTTQYESVPEVLRSAGLWVSRLNIGGIWLRSGWETEHVVAAIVAGGLLAALGVFGLARRDLPERLALGTALILGVALVTMGYWGHLGSPLSTQIHALFDGPLAPFRNIEKFQPVVNCCLALGLAHGASVLSRALSRRHRSRTAPPALGPAHQRGSRRRSAPARSASGVRTLPALGTLGVIGALALAAYPMLRGDAYQAGTWKKIPSYWYQAANWLDARGAATNTLLVPGSSYAEFPWGNTQDEPFTALMRAPWAVRDIAPLSSEGNIEILDEVDQVLASGEPAAGLAAFLRRAGITYIVVDNTLDLAKTSTPSPLTIRTVLAQEKGITPVAGFGRAIPSSDLGVSHSLTIASAPSQRPFYPLQIYRLVAAHRSPVVSYPEQGAITISGGPQALLELSAKGISEGKAVFIAGDPHGLAPSKTPDPLWVVTDTQKRENMNFGQLYDNLGYVLQAGARAPSTRKPPARFQVVPGSDHETTAVIHGAASVTASSYGAPITRIPGDQPLAAFLEHSAGAAWVAASSSPGAKPWIQITFSHPITIDHIAITPLDDGPWRPGITSVSVTTAAGTTTAALDRHQVAQTINLIHGRSSWLRVTITHTAPPAERGSTSGPGIAHIAIPGVTVTEAYQVPDDGGSTFSRAGVRPPIYIFTDPMPNRFNDLTEADPDPHMRRIFTVPRSASFSLTAEVTPRAGAPLLHLLSLLDPSALSISASSTYNGLPTYRAQNLIDNDPYTSWEAASGDLHPHIVMKWAGLRTLSHLLVARDDAASFPKEIMISSADGNRLLRVPPQGGTLSFPPLTTSAVTLTFPQIYPLVSEDTLTHSTVDAPIGLASLAFTSLQDLSPPPLAMSRTFSFGCGGGPSLTIDGQTYPTAARFTVSDLYELDSIPLAVCAHSARPGSAAPLSGTTAHLQAGRSSLVADDIGSAFKVTEVELKGTTPNDRALPARVGSGPGAHTTPRTVTVRSWGSTLRKLAVAPGSASVLALAQNWNAGWMARVNGSGRTLESVRVDGWRQAFVLPASTKPVNITLVYAPEGWFARFLLAGAILALMVLALAFIPERNRKQVRPHRPRQDMLPAGALPRSVLGIGLVIIVGFVAGPLALLAAVAIGVLFILQRASVTGRATEGTTGNAPLRSYVVLGQGVELRTVTRSPYRSHLAPAQGIGTVPPGSGRPQTGMVSSRRAGRRSLDWLLPALAGAAMCLAGVDIALHTSHYVNPVFGGLSYVAQALGVLAVICIGLSLLLQDGRAPNP